MDLKHCTNEEMPFLRNALLAAQTIDYHRSVLRKFTNSNKIKKNSL